MKLKISDYEYKNKQLQETNNNMNQTIDELKMKIELKSKEANNIHFQDKSSKEIEIKDLKDKYNRKKDELKKKNEDFKKKVDSLSTENLHFKQKYDENVKNYEENIFSLKKELNFMKVLLL